MTVNLRSKKSKPINRPIAMSYNKQEFAKLVINDLDNESRGRKVLRNYKQSEVRTMIENYTLPRNQDRLVEISQMLYAKSPQYKRLVQYFGGMATFAHAITPNKDISRYDDDKIKEQYIQIGELLKVMNLKHELRKVMNTAFIEDVFYGYVHRTDDDFYIQKIDPTIARISSVENGAFNYSIDMSHFQMNEALLTGWPREVQVKYHQWEKMRKGNTRLSPWVELDPENTICVKVNEEIMEVFPPFAGSFDAIFDIDGFKKLRKDREEIDNYMVLSQRLPMRTDTDNNNDFLIDMDMMMHFHNQAAGAVPENVGVITSPMDIEPLRFSKDRVDNDGVAKAERDFWSGSGTSQLLFNADTSTSQGLLMSIKTDEGIIFTLLSQIERWVNRFLRTQFDDLMFEVDMLDVTYFNRDEMQRMYLEASQYGVPVKTKLSAVIGLDPIETLSMIYLENDILEIHKNFIPLQSSHTMSGEVFLDDRLGRPKKDPSEVSDETARGHDKPNV